jgi:hypothetical protein
LIIPVRVRLISDWLIVQSCRRAPSPYIAADLAWKSLVIAMDGCLDELNVDQ